MRVPITFLLDADDEDIASWRSLYPDTEPGRLVLGEHYWIALSHARLRDAGVEVRLDNRVPDEGIVVFYAGDKRLAWQALRRGSRAMLVSVRSDRHPVSFADVEVVQNASSAFWPRSVHVPHWPQPGLVPRDPARGDVVRTVLFPGTPQNLHPDFGSRWWLDAMVARGLEFRCAPAAGSGMRAWNDCSDVDVMLAIRAGRREVRNKPAWKLFNAWLAGTPAILGPERGYRELRRCESDYIEATDPPSALAALDRLRASPELYAAMVANGRGRGRDHATGAVLQAWRALIDDVLLPQWCRHRERPLSMAVRRARDVVSRVGRLRGAR